MKSTLLFTDQMIDYECYKISGLGRKPRNKVELKVVGEECANGNVK